MILKKLDPRGSYAPTPGQYTCTLPKYLNIISSETAWPITAKFYVKHQQEGLTNVCINNPGHMTKKAAMPIYGKNPSNIFSGTGGQEVSMTQVLQCIYKS